MGLINIHLGILLNRLLTSGVVNGALGHSVIGSNPTFTRGHIASA